MNQSFNADELTGLWDVSILPSNIRIGVDCWLESKRSFDRYRSALELGLSIGDRVRVFNWATFNVEPTGYIEVGSDSLLVGPVFMCAERIIIGKRVVISYNVTIADSDFHPVDPIERKQDAIAIAPLGNRRARPPFISRPVVIEDHVSIGIGAIVLKGVHIAQGARVAAGSVVTADVAPGVEVAGNPARPIGEGGL